MLNVNAFMADSNDSNCIKEDITKHNFYLSLIEMINLTIRESKIRNRL